MIKRTLLTALLIFGLFTNNQLQAQEQMLGEVRIFAGNFAPRGWAFCEGQLLAISSNSALFSILGTTYGGDGRTTFALPDLRGRAPIGVGNGPGLSDIRMGQRGGSETSYITRLNMPAMAVSGDLEGYQYPGGDWEPQAGANSVLLIGDSPNTRQKVEMRVNGGNQSVNNRDPYLGVHYIIATQGYFPSRN